MQPDPADYLRLDVPHSLGTTAAGASFATSSGDILEVECFGPGAFRLRVGPSTRPDYGILVARAATCEVAQRRAGAWAFTAGESALEIMSDPLSILLRWKGQVVLRSITDERIDGGTRLPTLGRLRQGGLWSAAFALATGEPVYALGEQFGPLDKRGQLLHSHVHDAQGVNTGRAYKAAPFAWSTGNGKGAWGTFVHTAGTVTHGVGHPDWSHRSYAMMVEDEALDLFLFAGESPAAIVDLYTQMTGRPAPVPRWSLGLWVSRASFGGPDAALGVATRLRERKIPADVLMLDPATTYDTARGFDFTWDAERMSDAVATLAKIKERDFRVCVTEHPHVSVDSALFQDLASQQYLLLTPEGDPYVHAPIRSSTASTNAVECGIVDFTNADAYAWWRDEHASLFEDGVDAIASEFGEQVPDDAVASNGDSGARLHNVYPLLYNRCVFDATTRFAKPQDGPPIIWSRAGWAGSQRYPIGFGGAPQSDWEGFAASIRGGLSLGMSGNPYHSSDVGGFYGARPTPELFVRWLQAAVFFSHMRLNGIGEREPWTFGAEAEGIARKWLALRYRLIPYLERTIGQATSTGLPVSRAMPLAFPDSRLARDFETQFMCGDALLVAPIVREGGEVDIALPPGAWYDLNTRARYAGSQVLRYAAKLDQFPVFGREGFALPLGRAVQHTGEIHADVPLEALWIFGKPTQPLEGFRQVKVEADRMAGHTVRAMLNVDVQVFGDASAVSVLPL